MEENDRTQEHIGFVKQIICSVVKEPEAVAVVRSLDERGTLFTIRVSAADMPLIIGRKGNNIMAIKLVVRLYGRQQGETMSVIIEEPRL